MQKYHMPTNSFPKVELYLDYNVELNYLGCNIELKDRTKTEVSGSDTSL